MSGRNFDNIPHAANTVTISTSPQVRVNSTGQMRPIAVPMRQQPVPIRKVHHEGASTSSTMITKEDMVDGAEFQGSSSSGPLLPSGASPSSSNSFQQYQRGSGVQGTAGNQGGTGINNSPNNGAMDQPAPVNLASKVAEVFLTAGHAFQKLGDLALQLNTTTDSDESKWSDKEVDRIKDSLARFAHELDQISTCVASRSTRHIKSDIKRRHIMDDSNQQVKRMATQVPSNSGAMQSYGTIAPGMHTVPLAQKRMAIPAKVLTTRAIVPTRFAVGPMSSNGATSGMPQLQQQQQQNLQGTSSGAAQGRIGTSGRMSLPIGKVTVGTRMMSAKPASGALVLDPNE